jgi:hypothetical protein
LVLPLTQSMPAVIVYSRLAMFVNSHPCRKAERPFGIST